MSAITDELRQLLGKDVVLLPVPAEQKGPTLKGWQNVTVEKMSDPQYLASLNHGCNIGVLLGKNSNGLCTIDIDCDDKVEPFLKLNPKLRDTLQTRRGRGCNLWVRIKGSYPDLTKIRDATGKDQGEWRSSNSQTIIHGSARDKEPLHVLRPYIFLNKVPPIEIEFQEIAWPQDWVLPWKKTSYQELVQKYGELYQISEQGGISINQLCFVALFAVENRVLHEPAEKQFYLYDEKLGLWKRHTEDDIKMRFAESIKRIADEQNVPELINRRTNGFLSALTTLLRGHVEKRDAFNRKKRVIHFGNGMLHLDTKEPELRTFSHDYFSRNQCVVNFNEKAECPRFFSEFLRPALSEDDISLIQRWCGSVLLGGNPAQRFLILTGIAGGGKSTLVEIVEKVIGLANVALLRTRLLNERFELMGFIGKTLLSGKDVPGDFLEQKGASVIKALVGGDWLEGEAKFGGRVPFRGEFSIVITCNSRLRVKLDGDTGAWRRRLLIVNYANPKPEKPIPNFADRLIEVEGPGIISWMVAGAIEHLRELDEIGNFVLTPVQQDRIEVLLAESDSVREFVRRRVVRDPSSDAATSELVEAYVQFCDEIGWAAQPGRIVENQLPDLMLELHRVSKRTDVKRNGKNNRGFFGVRILEE